MGVRNEACRQTAYLVVGQEPFASPPAIAPDAPARIGTLGPKAHPLRLPHDDGEHRHRPVRGDRRRAQRRKPVPHLLPVDVGDGASGEIRQDLVPEVAAVHIEGSRLPDPLVVPEHGLGDGLEEGFVGPARHILPPADRGQHLAGAASCFPHMQRSGIADDFPDAFAPMLAVDEKAFAARGQHPDAKPLSLASRMSKAVLRGRNVPTRASVRVILGMSFLPVAVAAGEPPSAKSVPLQQNE